MRTETNQRRDVWGMIRSTATGKRYIGDWVELIYAKTEPWSRAVDRLVGMQGL